jgi:pimeloyl-ACP methyl ester carboxylesterase
MIARIGGATIGYDDVGEGTPVVFLHAFPLNRTMWKPQMSVFATDWRCITIDFRGFGESAPVAPFTIDRYADDVVELLDEIGVRRAIVVGLSMGGYVAFSLWRRHAPRLQALVLADTRAAADSPETRKRRHELMTVARTDGAGAVADRQVVGLLGKSTRERRAEIESAVHAIAASATVDGIVGGLEAMLGRPDSTPTLATLTIPTLVVVGDEDVITPPKEGRAMHAAIRGSRFELLTNAGHLSSVERPAAFNAVVTEFLNGVERSG